MEGHKPDGSVLKDLDSVRDSVITEAPSLASIANVRGKDSMVDIDKVRKREIMTEFRDSSICTTKFGRNNSNMLFPGEVFIKIDT